MNSTNQQVYINSTNQQAYKLTSLKTTVQNYIDSRDLYYSNREVAVGQQQHHMPGSIPYTKTPSGEWASTALLEHQQSCSHQVISVSESQQSKKY